MRCDSVKHLKSRTLWPPLLALLGALIVPAVGAAVSGPPADAILSEIAHSPTLERNVRMLCDEIGARPAGSAALERAAQWAAQAFREAGADDVAIESFEIPRTWREIKTAVKLIAPAEFSADAAATAFSPSTPAGGISAEIIDAGGGEAGRIRRLGETARGKILLVRLREAKTFYGLGVEQRNAIQAMQEAAEVGAAALLYASTRANGLLYRHIHSVDGSLDPLPSAVLAREDALRIARLLEGGREVRAHLDIRNEIGGPAKSWNVVAELRGEESPEESVILGAHLDSWDMGSGCLDNGVNVALVIESLRAIAASGGRPRRTLKFALFGAEEQGLLGSRAYVAQHRAELDDVTAVLVHDMGLGPIEGYSLSGRGELEPRLRLAMSAIAGRADRHSAEAFFGSDHFDFLLEGVPALVALQDTTDYVLPYHSEVDTFDRVSIAALKDRTSIAAATAFGLADLPERFGERLDREEVEALLERTSVDDQMQFLGLWDEWVSGERGREKEALPAP